MNARVQPIFPIRAGMENLQRQAERVAKNRYDAGFLAGEVVGFSRGLAKGRKDADGLLPFVLIAGICLGMFVGAGASVLGWMS